MYYNDSISFQIENTEISLFYEPSSFLAQPKTSTGNDNAVLCHQHPIHEIFIVLEGSMQLTDGTNTLSLNRLDVCIVPPKFFHTTFVSDEQTVHRVSLFFVYKKLENAAGSFDFYEIMNRLSGENATPLLFHISSTYLEILLDVLSNSEEMLTHTDILKIKSILSLIFINLLENYDCSNPATLEPYKRSIGFYKRIIALNELLSVRMENNNVSINDISEQLGLSPRHLNNIFSEEYGTSIKNFTYEMRMKQAAFLLCYYPKLTVRQISERLGYSSSEIFSIMFKRFHGVSASEYRRQHHLK